VNSSLEKKLVIVGSPADIGRQAATHSAWQRLGRAAALTLGSVFQANRDALEPVLRVLADVMALAADRDDVRPVQMGTTR
jgi:hypothetical protein